MGAYGWSAGGFWIFIAAVVVASFWHEARRDAERHETLRRIMDKTGTIDEAKLKELFSEDSPGARKSGGGYRVLRVCGTIIMFIGAAIATFFGAMELFSEIEGFIIGLSMSAGITVVGLGVFLASHFAEQPPSSGNVPQAR